MSDDPRTADDLEAVLHAMDAAHEHAEDETVRGLLDQARRLIEGAQALAVALR